MDDTLLQVAVFMFHYSFHVMEINECNLEVDFDILYITNLQGIY